MRKYVKPERVIEINPYSNQKISKISCSFYQQGELKAVTWPLFCFYSIFWGASFAHWYNPESAGLVMGSLSAMAIGTSPRGGAKSGHMAAFLFL